MISYFKNDTATKPTHDLTLSQIVQLIQSNDSLANELVQAQSIYSNDQLTSKEKKKEIDSLKRGLPAVTFSGRFSERKQAGLLQHSQLIVIDIDGIQSYEQANKLKKQIFDQCTSVVLAFISPSQCGVKVVHQLDWNNDVDAKVQQRNAFDQLAKYYRAVFDLTIDQSGKDVSRLCYLIGEPHLLSRIEGITSFPVKPKVEVINTTSPKARKTANAHLSTDAALDIVEDILTFVREKKRSITQSYKKWMLVGFAIKNIFGEKGRDLFHQFSFIDDSYDREKVDEQFDHADDLHAHKVGLGTIITLAKEQGYQLKKVDRDVRNSLVQKECEDLLIHQGYQFRFNTVRAEIEYRINQGEWLPIDPFAFATIYMQVLNRKLRRDDVTDFLFVIAEKYNPVDHFIREVEKTKVDTTHDYIQDLADTIQSTNDTVTYQGLKTWLVAFFRCLLDPQYANELIPVLIGEQGAGKTRWVERLVPNEWKHLFVSRNLDPTNKDDAKQVSINFWVNLDELSIILSARNSTESFKSFVSTKMHVVRLPYDKYDTYLVRRASVIGTSNESEYLRDQTGNRRFLSVQCLSINPDHDIDMMQVYKQAYDLYAANPKMAGVIKGVLAKSFVDHNEEHKTSNPYEELLQKYFQPYAKGDKELYLLTTTQIIAIINHHERNSAAAASGEVMGRNHASRVGTLLTNMGYNKSKLSRVKGIRGRFYEVGLNTHFNDYGKMQELGYISEVTPSSNNRKLFDDDDPDGMGIFNVDL